MDDAARDEPLLSYDLSSAVYGALPSGAASTSPRRSMASSPSRIRTSKRPRNDDAASISQRNITTSHPSWLPRPQKRNIMQHTQHMDLHQSTCLNLSSSTMSSDLWILPDFDEWAYEADQVPSPSPKDAEWAPFLRRAAHSNLERLRARLEGDGWAFVGGRYEEEKQGLKDEAAAAAAAASVGEESVDEEFDVVILPAVRAAC